MAPTSRASIMILDFLGLVSATGRMASDQAAMTAASQINLTCIAPDELTCRPGLRPVTFDEDSE